MQFVPIGGQISQLETWYFWINKMARYFGKSVAVCGDPVQRVGGARQNGTQGKFVSPEVFAGNTGWSHMPLGMRPMQPDSSSLVLPYHKAIFLFQA